jgi:hypothetical protein
MSSNDELAEINGIKPNVILQDGVEQEAKSASRRVSNIFRDSPSVYVYRIVLLRTRLSEPLIIITGETI